MDAAIPARPTISRLTLLTALCNIVVPLFFARFAWEHATAFIHTLRISNLLFMTKEILDVYFYLRKSSARAVSTSTYAWVIATFGTAAPLMFRPAHDGSDMWAATMIQVMGAGLQVLAICSLNRSFGLVPANRGIKTDGMYRFVRHPLYLTYLISQLGYVLNNPTSYNFCILVVATGAQILRIFEEERLLLQDPEYAAYARQTRWRLVPLVY
jgi:protein-S-isoprenylcysteine O-methyltransferase Ste14